MRYSSALVLGALAAGQVTAHSARHASFHARRHVDKKDIADVNWSDVTYDLSDISQEEWSSILKASATPAAASSAPAASSAAPAPATTSAAEIKAAAYTSKAADVTSKAAASPTSEKPAATTTASSDSSDLGDAIGDLFSGLSNILGDLGAAKDVVNSKTDNGAAWLGDDSNWKMNMKNAHSESIYVFCWSAAKAWINADPALIAVHLAAGQSQTVSFAENFSGACSHTGAGIDSLTNGMIPNTWAEFTFAPTYGVFDVSREVSFSGKSISMQGSKCLSDMETCVFTCANDAESCISGYQLKNCSPSNGGGTGVDYAGNGGASGGCMMGADGESIDVTFG